MAKKSLAKAKSKPRAAKRGAKTVVRAAKAKPKHVKRATPIKQSKKPAKKAASKPARQSAAKTKPSTKHAAAPKPAAKPAAVKKALPKPSVSKKAAPARPEPHPIAHPAPSAAAPKAARNNGKSAYGVAVAAPGSEPGITKEDGRYALPATVNIDLPKGYRPSSKEEYMGPKQLAYFRNKLRDWREQLVEESRQTMENLREEVRDVGDDAERATRETENSLELRTRDRYRKLISKIDKALRRIEEGRYGYCEETDEEIGLERLEARPIATLSLDAQERREHLQKQMGD
ncbi:MAG TPA: RNA polymerase-binding protein DksA [Rhodanobacteraceae bacterium]|nr:RNA polymerase-binding protein DksA [Rhodanobacteraceae bacterium]